MKAWHIISGEYPPQTGGVGDYTQLIASGLAARGAQVHVWTPRSGVADSQQRGVEVHRLPDHFGPRSLFILSRAFRAAPDDEVLVQYVPHAFGVKAMNVPFCIWLSSLRRCGISVMFHEIAFPISRRQGLRHNLLGAVTRVMARGVCRAATRIMVASARWEPQLRALGATVPIEWMPVPSNVPVTEDPAATRHFRERFRGTSGIIVGHFGANSNYATERLLQIMPALIESDPRLSLVLIGSDSNEARRRLIDRCPILSSRVHATGILAPRELSCALAACDLMIQPYPDGISARRTSTMAAIAHGLPVVTNCGGSTEPLWAESGAVALAPVDDPGVVRDLTNKTLDTREAMSGYARAGVELYERRFALRHTLDLLMTA